MVKFPHISMEIKGHQLITALWLTANDKQEKELFLQQSELKTWKSAELSIYLADFEQLLSAAKESKMHARKMCSCAMCL